MSLLVRKAAPAFEADAVVNGDIARVSLKSLQAGGKYTLLFWYPLDWTFVCPTEITAFSDRFAEFDAINTSVAAISIDSKFSHLAWVNTPRNKGGLGDMKIPVISDVTKAISKSYGVLVEDPEDDMCGITLRSTVIINPAGKVVHISTNDAPVGRSVDEFLRLVQAFQYVDKYGEVCPAGWKPGMKSMKADPKGSLEYFAATS